MSAFSERLAEKFAPHGDLSPEQLATLDHHYNLLLKWNQKINLTRIVGLEESVEMHYCESLYVARFLPGGPLRIADIGSGAGFPGIPMAILRPDCRFDLIEADHRKAVFLQEATRELPRVKTIARRVDAVSEKYDWAVSRAVAIEDVLGPKLAGSYLILGSEGEKLPWGENRRVRIVVSKPDVPRETSS